MKTSRADIRIVKLPKTETVGVIRNFVDSNNFVLEKDVGIDEKTTNIRAHNHIESFLKFWWKGTPQVLDWKIIELGDGQTRIETRFGLLTQFTVWFWAVLIALCSPLIIFIVGIGYKSFSITSFFFRASLLFVGAIFSLIIHSSYESLLHQQYKFLNEKAPGNNVLEIQSNCVHPLTYTIMYFWIFIAVVILTLLFGVTNRVDPIVVHGAIILTCLMTLLYYLRKMSNKWVFGTLSAIVTISIILLYSLPYLHHFQSSTFIHLHDQYAEIKKTLSELDNNEKQQDSSEETLKTTLLNKLNKIKVQFVFMASFDLVVILLICFYFFFILLKMQDDRGVRAEMLSAQGRALLKGLAGPMNKGYFIHVFVFWVIVSCYIYVLVYTTLSIFELNIFGKNRLFLTIIAGNFIEDIKFIVSFLLPMNQTNSDIFARALIVVYCLPLFYAIYRVIKKRMRNYIKVRVERKKYLLTDRDDCREIHVLSELAAAYSDVTPPDIVVVPSKLPRVSTAYAGFPIFGPYIRLTDGVLRLKSVELMCLIIHEMYHIKRHSFKWYLLNLFSDFTFFGTGFLSIATDSYQFELDADYHAACWAKENGAVFDFINALRIMSWSYFPKEGVDLDIGGGDFITSKEEKMEELFIKKNIRKIDAFFELYFGDEIFSYIHPPLEKRIERIKEIGREKLLDH